MINKINGSKSEKVFDITPIKLSIKSVGNVIININLIKSYRERESAFFTSAQLSTFCDRQPLLIFYLLGIKEITFFTAYIPKGIPTAIKTTGETSAKIVDILATISVAKSTGSVIIFFHFIFYSL